MTSSRLSFTFLHTFSSIRSLPSSLMALSAKQLFLFLLLHFLFSRTLPANWYPKSLPCDVTVNAEKAAVIVDCSDRHLLEIPWGIPLNATNLTLTINHIPTISSISFGQLENLLEIDFRCNCLPVRVGPKDHVCTSRPVIQDNSFASLTNLKSLYLDGNQLLEIPRGLPPNLLLLSLEANSIYSITKQNLSELVNIEFLYLGQNCYYRNPCNTSFNIHPEAFQDLKNLTVLSLKSNNLTDVPIGLSSSIKELYLYNNAIQKIKDNDFHSLNNLEILDLSGNCPRCYNAPYPCIPCAGNAQIQIDSKAFDSLTKLKILRLHSNSLQSVQDAWFKNIKNLQTLDLSQNFLAEVIGEAHFLKYVPNLVELDLSFNYELQRYPTSLKLAKTFSSLSSLEIFRIRGYVFKELKKDSLRPLLSLKKLKILDLGTNFIKIADLSVFKEFPALKLIDLSVNKISPSSSESTYYGSCSLTRASTDKYNSRILHEMHYFRYDENGRSCKSKDRKDSIFQPLINRDCLNYGETLDLSRNNIFFVNSKDFQHLTFLKCLNLSGNAISQSLNGSEFQPLSNLKYLDFSNNRIDLLYSTAFQELKHLEVLDLSNNKYYFLAEGVTHMLNFTRNLRTLKKLMMNSNEISTSTNTIMESQSLHTLEFKGNRLDILWRDGDIRFLEFFKKLSNLQILDISDNSLNFLPPGVFEGMPPNLEELYLTNNKLKTFNWGHLQFLRKLKILDLSNNILHTVPRELSNCTITLRNLILQNNKIHHLTKHFLRNAFQLRYLDLRANRIKIIKKSSFPENVLNNLRVLFLQNNPFLCNCDAVWFVWWINHTTVTIPKLATDVTCAGPGVHRGQSMVLLDMYTCELDSLHLVLYSVSASIIICLMVITVTSHLFFWDVWYIYHFCAARFKGYRRLPSMETCYDAFIAYDSKDLATSEWVLNELVAELENEGDKKFNLCLEERDWVPGQPILDNLSESIQLSKKTVFILTRRYIMSGQCKTAFYLAHQRLLDEKLDVIILVYLEKILLKSKYLRLRKRLCSRSVLDWPNNPKSQPYFWHCLKNAMATENHMVYNKLFKECV
ncbi:toll-like receptor 7 [Rhinatrema bivittatum]|uniref:toll-like receptor 7 n=1 Tax=Rhinatrema bivittatum TaxID=194408 RepID=UPI00112D8E68|nr:toll-like receptor 7 [Rhinatrema bivittatum]